MLHILPSNDIFDHIDQPDCNCNPKIKDGVCVHNSFDRRELFESDAKLSFYETLEKIEIIFFDFCYRVRTRIRLLILFK
jgi:hypothetical protein